jgi:hypothetical protein
MTLTVSDQVVSKGDAIEGVVGAAVTGGLGDESVVAKANVSVTGVSATFATGSEVVTASAVTPISTTSGDSLSAEAQVGQTTISISLSLVVTGLEITQSMGNLFFWDDLSEGSDVTWSDLSTGSDATWTSLTTGTDVTWDKVA